LAEAEIEAVGVPAIWTDVFDTRQLVVLRLADAVCGESQALPPDLVVDLRAHFGEVELAELILVAGQANFNNRAGNAAKQLLGPDRRASGARSD
jgi:alkylhydroperoxidase family enzyme